MVALAALLLGAQDARELIKAGQAYLQAEDPDSALKAFDAALRIAPDEAAAWLGRAYARLGLKQPVEDCAKDVERALEFAPESPDVRMARGALRQMRGLHAEAVADFSWILEKDPGNAGARRRRGLSCYELDRYPEAAADFTAAIEAGVKDPGVFLLRGRCRNSLLDMRGAVADATRVLNEQPGNADARLLRATSHYALGSWENASRDLDLYFATESSYQARIWDLLAKSRIGKGPEGAAKLREALKGLPPERAAQPLPGLWLCFLGEREEAPALKALETDGQRGGARAMLGHRALLKGDTEAAFRHFEAAARDAPVGSLERAAAEHALREREWSGRRATLDELGRKLRALKPFEVRYDLLNLEFRPGQPVTELLLWVDPARSMVVLRLRGGGGKPLVTVLADGLDFRYVVDGEPGWRQHFGPLLEGFEEIERNLAGEFAAVAGAPPALTTPGPGLTLRLDLEPKPDARSEGTFRFAAGRAGQAASWLREGYARPGRARLEGGLFVLEYRNKKVAVDAASGLLDSIETRDFDGKTRAIRRTSTAPSAAPPAVDIPRNLRVVPFDVGEVGRIRSAYVAALAEGLAHVLNHWEKVAAVEGGPDRIHEVVLSWAARYADSVYVELTRRAARGRIDDAVEAGAGAEAMLASGAERARAFAEEFGKHAEEFQARLNGEIENLAEEVETGVLEAVIDTRHHVWLREILLRSFSPKAVEPRRVGVYGNRVEKLFLDELERLRKL